MALPHVIISQQILIETDSVQSAKDVQQKFHNLLNSALFLEELEQLFNGVSGEEDWTYYDKIELDLGNLSPSISSVELKKRVLKKVSECFSEADSEINSRTKNTEHSEIRPRVEKRGLVTKLEEAWIMFITAHQLPQALFSEVQSIHQFILLSDEVLKRDNQTFESWFLEMVKKINTNKLKSLPFSFWKEIFSRHLLKTEGEEFKVALRDLEKLLYEIENGSIRVIRETKEVLVDFYIGQDLIPLIRKNIKTILIDLREIVDLNATGTIDLKKARSPMLDGVSENKLEIDKRIENKIAPKDEVNPFIRNAGMVLVFPFLPVVFKSLKYLEKDKLVEPNRALLFLQYVEKGVEEFAPHYNRLYKLVCGLPENHFLESEIKLNKKEKKEADELLTSVIEHWGVLKNTTPNGLRDAFLHRDGKIVKKGFDYYLKVESKGQDILLSRIPWVFGVIHLPWMTNFLHVDW